MQQDWHPADIIAALKKRGTSLSALSRKAGLTSGRLTNTLWHHWPEGERLIVYHRRKSGHPVIVGQTALYLNLIIGLIIRWLNCWLSVTHALK